MNLGKKSNKSALRLKLCGHLILVVLILSASACRREQTSPPLRIGLITYLEGPSVEIGGIPALNAAELMVETVNTAGGVSIQGRERMVELAVEGIGNSPEEAVHAVRKLVTQDKVLAIVGPLHSNEAIPAGAVAEAMKIPLISPGSTHPATTSGRRFVFRSCFTDDLQGTAMAQFALQDLGARRAAILYDITDEYSKNLATIFQKAFTQGTGEVVAFEHYTIDTLNFRSILARIRFLNPEVLYLPSFQQPLIEQVRAIQELGSQIDLLGSDSWAVSTDLLQDTDLSGAFFTDHWLIDLAAHPQGAVFVQQYREKFGKDPSSAAALTYDALGIVLAAAELADSSDPLELRDGLYALGPYQGVTGIIDYVTSGDPEKEVLILKVDQDRIQLHKVVSR